MLIEPHTESLNEIMERLTDNIDMATDQAAKSLAALLREAFTTRPETEGDQP